MEGCKQISKSSYFVECGMCYYTWGERAYFKYFTVLEHAKNRLLEIINVIISMHCRPGSLGTVFRETALPNIV